MKHIKKILLFLTLLVSFLAPLSVFAAPPLIILENGNAGNNVNIGSLKAGRAINNDKLDLFGDGFIQTSSGGEKSLFYSLVRIARDLKNFFFIASTIYFSIIVINLLMADHTSDELDKFKKGIIWMTVGLMVMQISYVFVKATYDMGVGETVAFNLLDSIVNPMVHLLEFLTAVFFLAIMFFAFYRLITANGAEEKIKLAKASIIYAIVGFIVVKFAQALVEAVYGTVKCTQVVGGIIQINGGNCVQPAYIEGSAGIVVTLINWLNSFVGIVVVIMILYAGFLVFTSAGEEDKLKKAKRIILYIAIGMFILVANRLILTFFIIPEAKIG